MRLAELEAHIVAVGELLDIVGAMRSLASMRVQEAQRTLPGIRRYTEMMATAIGTALQLGAEEPTIARRTASRRLVVLYAAEHGFVGGFNERLIEAAAAGASDPLLVIGTRGAVLAQERGRPPLRMQPMASRPEGVPEMVGRLTAGIYDLILNDGINRVEVIFARHRQGQPIAIERRQLLPIDRNAFPMAPSQSLPLANLPAARLLEKLVADYVFAILAEAAIESLASENAARFVAMQAAHDNVEKKLDQLNQAARQARQGEITEELLDLVTGSEALHQTALAATTRSRRPARIEGSAV